MGEILQIPRLSIQLKQHFTQRSRLLQHVLGDAPKCCWAYSQCEFPMCTAELQEVEAMAKEEEQRFTSQGHDKRLAKAHAHRLPGPVLPIVALYDGCRGPGASLGSIKKV